jgi:DNA-binding NarL/FixJ family response regulator
MSIRIVLAEDHFLLREGLRRLLEAEGDLEVVAVCEDFDALLSAVVVDQPDVVITDIRMPPTHLDEGIRAAEQLRETHPGLGVVVLSQYVEPGYAHALFAGGTERRAYLLKERVSEMEQLAGAIRAVATGGSAVDPKVVEALVGAKARSDSSPLHDLTPRELDVLREMAEGKNNASIAASLFLTERSVEKVIHSIFQKLGLGWDASVHKRVKAVILYLSDPEMGTEALKTSPDTVT